MRKFLLLSLLPIFVLACNSTNKSNESEEQKDGQNASGKKYEIESGIISYKMDMMGMETKMTTFFKDYGKIEASITETDMMGQKTKIQTLQKDNYAYTYTSGQNIGTKVIMNDKTTQEGGGQRLDEAAILKMGGKKVGTEKILGKDCIIYELTESGATSKIWIWKSLFLKTVISQNEMEMTMEAFDFKETSDFPAGVFELPQNIKFTEPQNNTQPQGDFEDANAKG